MVESLTAQRAANNGETSMMHDNNKWQEFRDELETKGVTMRFLWEARRDGKAPKWPKLPADVGMVSFTGSGFQPGILCAVVIDYGPKNGFGLFTDESRLLADDVTRIATPHKNAA
jgi:hypothetical protein